MSDDTNQRKAFFISGGVEAYDLEGDGDTLREALLAYAKQAENSAAECRREALLLDAEASRVRLMAAVAEGTEAERVDETVRDAVELVGAVLRASSDLSQQDLKSWLLDGGERERFARAELARREARRG